MVKLKRSPKNLELHTNVAKTGNSAFSMASSKFCGRQRILQRGVNICVLRNTGGPGYEQKKVAK